MLCNAAASPPLKNKASKWFYSTVYYWLSPRRHEMNMNPAQNEAMDAETFGKKQNDKFIEKG
jgi:hypothetical protein